MKFLIDKFKKAYDKKIDGTGLAVFRILYSIVLLFEIRQIYYFRHLIFDKIPYLDLAEINFSFPLILWAISVLFMLFGAYTRIAIIVNYVLALSLIGTITSYEYHVFYAYMGLNALLLFLPVERCLSVDRIRKRLQYSTPQKAYTPPRKVSSLAYLIPMLVGGAFVYSDSVLYKMVSYNWMNGLGMWLPANLPQITHFNSSGLMNIKGLAIFLGYFTIFFEAVFIFLFWFKPFRIPLLIIGVGLHLGIMLEFPIPWFALCVVALYALMVPVGWWKTILDKFPGVKALRGRVDKFVTDQVKATKSGKYHKENPVPLPLSDRKRKMFGDTTVRDFKVKWVGIGVIVLCVLQLLVTYNSGILARSLSGFNKAGFGKSVQKFTRNSEWYSKRLLGITNHPVFMDGHFNGYNHIVAVTHEQNGKETWLPIVDERGMPDSYVYGFNWVKWTFRVNGTYVNQGLMLRGLRDFSAFWAKKNNVDLNNAKFNVKVKKVRVPRKWEKNFLNKEIKQPWIDGGSFTWTNRQFRPNVKEIEKL